jgi:hypothetical protein
MSPVVPRALRNSARYDHGEAISKLGRSLQQVAQDDENGDLEPDRVNIQMQWKSGQESLIMPLGVCYSFFKQIFEPLWLGAKILLGRANLPA